ncbi:MAG: GNAT family N-acetyltransferase [Pseudomonadota bacterium]
MNQSMRCVRSDTPIPSARHPGRIQTSLAVDQCPVATIRWCNGPDYLTVIEIWVEPSFRRRGIATKIYNTLRLETGLPLVWIRNALASPEMKKLVESYLAIEGEVVSDDGNTVVLKTIQTHAI